MLDFSLVRKKEKTMAELCGNLSLDDLRDLTNEMIDAVLDLMADCIDEDVVFVPEDPEAQDNYAATEAETNMAWTLGHLVVHITASSEEAAFLAAELARGVDREGRSRYETPWETVKTMAQCRERLEDSRRIRLATLEVWPNPPQIETTTTLGFLDGVLNPPARFCTGLSHESSHLDQIAEVVRQARVGRS